MENNIINVTNHEFNFLNCLRLKGNNCPTRPEKRDCRNCNSGLIYTVEPSGIVISAKTVEETLSKSNGVEFVKTSFEPSEESRKEIEKIDYENNIVVGSLIAAQAFPGKVVATIPVPGYERVPPQHKLVRDDKFTKFEEGSK